MKTLFLAYPQLKSKAGAEKIIFSLAGHFSQFYSVFLLSDDSSDDLEDVYLNTATHLYVPYGNKNVIKIFISFFFLSFYLIRYKPAVIHSHHRRITLLFSALKFLPFFRSKILHTSHNVFEYGKYFKNARGDLYSGVSRSVVKNLTDFFQFDEDKVRLIYNGIEEYKGKSSSPESSSALVAARLTEQKGHIYLLKAWKEVIYKIPKAKLYIAGEGDLENKLKETVVQLNLGQHIHFLGFQSNPKEWILKTEFCVLSSLWEGLPLFPLEAFSVKRTIVATAVDGTPEIVHDKKTGLLVPPKDVERLAESIVYLFSNPEARKEMAEAGHTLFKDHFTTDKMLSRYEKIYKDLLN